MRHTSGQPPDGLDALCVLQVPLQGLPLSLDAVAFVELCGVGRQSVGELGGALFHAPIQIPLALVIPPPEDRDPAMGPDPLLSPHQILVAMVTITLFMPCVATLFMIAKEHGRKVALAMTLFIFPFAFLVGGLVHRLGGALGL